MNILSKLSFKNWQLIITSPSTISNIFFLSRIASLVNLVGVFGIWTTAALLETKNFKSTLCLDKIEIFYLILAISSAFCCLISFDLLMSCSLLFWVSFLAFSSSMNLCSKALCCFSILNLSYLARSISKFRSVCLGVLDLRLFWYILDSNCSKRTGAAGRIDSIVVPVRFRFDLLVNAMYIW